MFANVRFKPSVVWALLGLLAVVLMGCYTTPTAAPAARQVVGGPTTSSQPIDRLQLAHQRMATVGSFRAHLDIEITASEQSGMVSLNLRREQNGNQGVIMTVDAPGLSHRQEMVRVGEYIYTREASQEWVRHNVRDLERLGTLPAWAVTAASSIDFFGNLLPGANVPWDVYDVRSRGEESVGDVQVERLEVRTGFPQMWEHIDSRRSPHFVLASALGMEPRELFQYTKSSKLELWIDKQGFVHQMVMEMVLEDNRTLRARMVGYDFDKDVWVQVPGTTTGEASGSAAPSPWMQSGPSSSESAAGFGSSSPSTPDNVNVSDTPPATSQAPTTGPAVIRDPSNLPMSRSDVIASLSLGISLHRRNLSQADLSHTHLAGAKFQDSDLSEVNLYAANLSQSDLRGPNLLGADLTRADLRLADLRRAQLTGVDLSRLDMEAAVLNEIQLAGSNLNAAYLLRATLAQADLEGANLSRTFLKEANLRSANLRGADLTNADLTGADLTNADLTDARLSGAILKDARLQGTVLFGADLRGADLSGATLIGVELTAAELGGDSASADSESTDASEVGGGAAKMQQTFFDRGTTWSKAFCGDVHRCTREMLMERGALIGG